MTESTSHPSPTEPTFAADHNNPADPTEPTSEGATHVATQTDLLAHPGIVAVTTRLRELGAQGEIHVFSDGVRTAKAAAAALGCEVGAIANSLVFDAAGSPVLILTSGAHRVDTAATAARIGASSLDRAAPDFVREHTGQTIGGVAPVGHPKPIATYLDQALASYETIWAAAGHSHSVFPTTYDELRRITGATEIEVD
jgi:prolyl-tRNA editing enzyme YbaK/EbsC (Cys-tRNA(Pro) deacylase)